MLDLASIDLGQAFSAGMWMMLVIALAVAGLMAAKWVKRWAQRPDLPASFTLQDLRDMRSRGEISEAEFARLKAGVTARGGATPPRATPPDDAGPRAES